MILSRAEQANPSLTVNIFDADQWSDAGNLVGYHWKSNGSRANVLLQHGYGEYAGRYFARYNALVPSLLAAGFDVYAFDLAGHGLSPGERGLTDISASVHSHQAVRKVLQQRDEPLFLIGHSLGGLVTAASVAQRPDGVAGVILTSPALPSRPHVVTVTFARLISAIAPRWSVTKCADVTGLSRIEQELAFYHSDPHVFQRGITATMGASALQEAFAMWPRLSQWYAPTLVLHGDADSYTDPSGSERLISALSSPDKKLQIISQGRHELLNDIPRDEVLSLLIGWLRARLPT